MTSKMDSKPSLTIPRPVLARLNARQERFCQLVAGGSSLVSAYRVAYADLDQGGDPAHDYAHATGVYQHPRVQARIADLLAATEVTAEWIVRQGKRIVESADSETAQVQALTLLARLYPNTFSGGGAGGTRVNVVAGSGASVNVSTSLGAGLDAGEAREIAARALRSLLDTSSAPEPQAQIIDVESAGGGVTP